MDTDKTNINDNITKLAEKFAGDFVKDGLVNEDGTIPMAEWKNMSGVIKFDPEEWGTFTLTEDQVSSHTIKADANYIVQFFNKDQKSAGKFDFNGDKLKFEGDLHESAEILITFLLNVFNQKIEQIKDEAALKGYKNGWKEAIEEYSEQFDPRED